MEAAVDDAPIRRTGSRVVYASPWMTVREDDIEYADGTTSVFGVVAKNDFALVLPRAELADALAALGDALSTEHALVLDVSDMRVAFRITGPRAGQVLTKLSPAEIGAMPPDGLRRSRAAQAACGIWREADGYVLIGFRSIADYLQGILTGAAIPGSGLEPR